MAYDWVTGELAPIINTPLPNDLASFCTWNPDMTRGVQLVSNRLAGTLYWITPAGIEPMKVVVGEGKRSWSLDQDLVELLAGNRTEAGLAGEADWSPNGEKIAMIRCPGETCQSAELLIYDVQGIIKK